MLSRVRLFALFTLALLTLLGCAGTIQNAASSFGYILRGGNQLQAFRPSDGALIGSPLTLSTSLRDIAFRSNGQLYGIDSGQVLYRVSTVNGTCTPAAIGSIGFVNNSFGMAIYPGFAQLRVVVSSGENYRYDSSTGILFMQDPNMNFDTGDPNSGTPTVAAIAYDGSPTPVLYGIDGARDVLVRIVNENAGTTQTVGALGFNAAGDVSMTIDPGTNIGYAVWDGAGAGFYQINLSTGALTLITASITDATGIAIPD